VVEHRGEIEHDFEDHDAGRRDAPGGDDGHFVKGRKQDLESMKPPSRRHVEFGIGVMHTVQTPKQRKGVKRHVLQIDRTIEEQKPGDRRKERRRVQQAEETAPLPLGEEGCAQRPERNRSGEQPIEKGHAEIGGPALTPPPFTRTARPELLECSKTAEGSGEKSHPQKRGMCDEPTRHGTAPAFTVLPR
jgi:hypothetical protein